jgi:hypothetical protein
MKQDLTVLSRIKGLAWLIIMGSGFDDWVYWHFFIITVDYNSSHIEHILNDVCLTNLYEYSLSESYDRRSVGQFVLESSVHLGLTTRLLLLSDSCGFVDVGCSRWREDGSVIYNCCWPSPAQSVSGPSLVGLATMFYCLLFETSLFVVSHDSKGYSGGIRPRLQTGIKPLMKLSRLN